MNRFAHHQAPPTDSCECERFTLSPVKDLFFLYFFSIFSDLPKEAAYQNRFGCLFELGFQTMAKMKK
jgi:hypothetical protein